MVMFFKDNVMTMKNRDTVFIKGITEMSMMDSGKMATNHMEFIKMLKLEKFIEKYMKTERLCKGLR
jgi:hypothetical protein